MDMIDNDRKFDDNLRLWDGWTRAIKKNTRNARLTWWPGERERCKLVSFSTDIS